MTPLLVVVVLVAGAGAGAAIVLRLMIARRVERLDALRPRSPTGVVKGAEGFTLERAGAPGVLLLHGGGDTPQTLRELGEYLFRLGFAVSAPLLPGHGTRVRDFRYVTADSWRSAAAVAYDRLALGRPWVGIVGLSMGGALAAITVADRADVSALVLLAPYLELPRGLRVAAALSRVAEMVSPYYSAADPRSVRDPEAAIRGLAYGEFTPAAVRALRHIADSAAAALPRIQTPTLIVQSRQDNRIDQAVATRALARLSAADKRLEWVSDSGHVLTVDYGKEHVFDLTAQWLITHGAGALLRS